ncbi:unnamed protein product [Mytilus edulis]|uniref:Uncharacterized protein n=1 Tax=Mytilus edulis TaxID=6550 RepID=A0A8S3QDS9_MYTED|nr:unnamed protein product [Mytilus edulis]
MAVDPDFVVFKDIHSFCVPHAAWRVALRHPLMRRQAHFVTSTCCLIRENLQNNRILCDKCGKLFDYPCTHAILSCDYTVDARDQFWRSVIDLNPISFSVHLGNMIDNKLLNCILACDTDFDLQNKEQITEFGKKSFLIDNANVTVVEKGYSFNDRVLVQNIHNTTTKDGLKCFVKSQTGQDLQSIIFDKIGKAILDFGNVIGIIDVCKREHNLKGKTLGVQIYYQCLDRDDKLDFLTERKTANRKLLNRHEHYNIHSNTTTDVAKKRKLRTSDTGQYENKKFKEG